MKKRRKRKVKKNSSTGVLTILLVVALISLFSETMRSIPVGAYSENFSKISYKVPKLNSNILEKKYLKNNLKIKNNETMIIEKVKESIIFDEFIKEEITIAKIVDNDFSFNEQKVEIKEIIDKKETTKTDIIDVPKVEETIKLAAETKTKSITINGEETLIPGSSDKNITYMQILQNPNDLDLNLKYAKQQSDVGNFKQTIATLERLNMLYPDNLEIKLYLLSVLVSADSPNKALTVIEEIKNNEDVTAEDLATVNEIEEEMKARGAPKLWYIAANIDLGGIQNNNVNSVSKTRLKMSSDSREPFASAMVDRTYTGGLGLMAVRTLSETSSLTILPSFTESRQDDENSDDFQGYSLFLGYDTIYKNQSLSPYLSLGKTDYDDDADSFSLAAGLSGSFSIGDRHSFGYGYSFSNAKGNQNSTDTTADDTNAIGHGISLSHGLAINEIVSSEIGLGFSVSEAVDGTNDVATYDFNYRFNFALPWAYISVGEALSFNDYYHIDTSVDSNRIRSDYTNTFDIMAIKALGEIFPALDPNKQISLTISYEKLFSEANIINYDYISDSISLGISKSIHLNK
tara:strand:- start:182 stop:1903 length:1722 start_codon:yes stop_codon:yes gene_type:complete